MNPTHRLTAMKSWSVVTLRRTRAGSPCPSKARPAVRLGTRKPEAWGGGRRRQGPDSCTAQFPCRPAPLGRQPVACPRCRRALLQRDWVEAPFPANSSQGQQGPPAISTAGCKPVRLYSPSGRQVPLASLGPYNTCPTVIMERTCTQAAMRAIVDRYSKHRYRHPPSPSLPRPCCTVREEHSPHAGPSPAVQWLR